MSEFDRRKVVSSAIGALTLGSFGGIGLANSKMPTSPANPSFLYGFNARGLVSPTPSIAMSFSHSGNYLAILSDGTYFSGPELLVWNIADRKAVFRSTDPNIVTSSSTGFKVEWGPDDAWLAFSQAKRGVITLFEPFSGKLLNKITLPGQNFQFNYSGNKILYTKGIQNSLENNITVFDIQTNSEVTIPLPYCKSGIHGNPAILQWYDEHKIVAIGRGFVSTGSKCSTEEMDERNIHVELPESDFYYIGVIDIVDPEKRSIKRFEGEFPWFHKTLEVSKDGSFGVLDRQFLLNLKTFSVVEASGYQDNLYTADCSVFSADGKYLYVANSGNDLNFSYIIDVSSNSVVGTMKRAARREIVCVSRDGKYLALSRDGAIELYTLI